MTLHRLACLGLLVALTAHASPADVAARDQAVSAIRAARAPLAVSGDGAWRLHVDSRDVLHRASLADPAHDSATPMPPGVQVLAASGDGRRVVLATNRACVGRVDFGADDSPGVVTWRPIEMSNGTPMRPAAGAWVAQMPADCGVHEPAPPVAISQDGRWIATPEVVVDAATNQVIASLPPDDGHTLRLQFVDHDTRVLVVRAAGAREEDIAVWDLPSKALVNHLRTPVSALPMDVSAATGTLFQLRAVDGEPRLADLVQVAPGTCGSEVRRRARVDAAAGTSFVVDPFGRWFASVQAFDAEAAPDQWNAGQRSELVVRELASGRELARSPSTSMLGGLVALPDGGGVLAKGTRAIDALTEGIADQLVRIDLAPAIAALPRDAARPYETGYCREPGEAPGARAMARFGRLLAPAWTHDLGADAAAAPAVDTSACPYASAAPVPFRTADGGLWFDVGTQVLRLDPRTGAVLKALPTPRARNVCSVVTPAGTGFLNATGDTLTWRPLAAADDKSRRHVIERRPGWTATLAPARADVVRVLWTSAHAGDLPHLNVTDYDSGGKRTSSFDVVDGGADGLAWALAQTDDAAPACRDVRGLPVAIGYDWRAGPFGTQRGSVCGPLPGVARLVWWSGTTVAPRPQGVVSLPVIAPAIDGAMAVVDSDAQLHVVNLALQREVAQIALDDVATGHAWVFANLRLVLVESASADGRARVRAYALP